MIDRKNSDKLMGMLGLDETTDKMAKTNEVRWHGHVLRREENDVIRKAWEFKIDGQKKRGRTKMT